MILLIALLLIVVGFASGGGEETAVALGEVLGVVVGLYLLYKFLMWLLGPTKTPKRYT
jgi:Kef-type K+ transport system membrane component KefB